MLNVGFINVEFLDEKEIYSTPGNTIRDGLTECHLKAFLVTHLDTVDRQGAIEDRRLEAARMLTPEAIALQAAMRIMEKERKCTNKGLRELRRLELVL